MTSLLLKRVRVMQPRWFRRVDKTHLLSRGLLYLGLATMLIRKGKAKGPKGTVCMAEVNSVRRLDSKGGKANKNNI